MTEATIRKEIPPLDELIMMNETFGRLLERRPMSGKSRLYGVDGKPVEPIETSGPKILHLGDRIWQNDRVEIQLENGNIIPGYDTTKHPQWLDWVLTPTELQLVLGTNYNFMDNTYAGPNWGNLRKLFLANNLIRSDYNAFEFGDGYEEVIDEQVYLPIVCYKITDERFKELSNTINGKKSLIDAVKRERGIV
jgi:hypothetical protein